MKIKIKMRLNTRTSGRLSRRTRRNSSSLIKAKTRLMLQPSSMWMDLTFSSRWLRRCSRSSSNSSRSHSRLKNRSR